MAKAQQQPVDMTGLSELTGYPETDVSVEVPLSAGPKVVGSITIDFLDDGGGHLVPKVSFNPLGRITPGVVDRFMPLLMREIQREQVRLRREELENGR